MMTCDLILEWFDDYYDGSLEASNRSTFEAHLESCETCKAMVADLTLMREVMLDMPLVSLPQDFNETLHEKLQIASQEIKQTQSQQRKILPFRMKQAGPLVGLAAAMLIIATGTAQLGKLAWWTPSQNELAYDTAMTDAAAAPEASANQVAPEAAPQAKQAAAIASTNGGSEVANTGAADAGMGTAGTATDPQLSLGNNRQLVRTGQISMTVGDMEVFAQKIQTLTEQAGGYIESSYTGANEYVDKNQSIGNQLSGSFVLRVPANVFPVMLEDIKKLGKVESSQQNVMDVTSVVVDIEASLENLKSRELTLKSLMGTAKTVEEVMSVEKELSATRMQIDQLTAQLKSQKSQVSFSTIYINATQSIDVDNRLSGVDKNVFGLAYQGLIKNINLVTQWLQTGFIWLVSWSPAILATLLAAFGMTRTKTYKNWRKK